MDLQTLSTMDIEPGFVKLRLQVNVEDFDYNDVAQYQFPTYLHELEENMHRPERNAIRNFLGYLAACLGWHEESKAYFNDVLNEDRDNLNALANLKWVYKELIGCKRRAKELAKRIEELQLALNGSGDRGKVMKARCLAEKGYAICHDVSHEYEEEFRKACEMYDRAIEMAGHLVSHEEKLDWYLGRVRAKQILFTKQTRWRKAKDAAFETQLISDIQEVLRQGDNIMKAEAWIKLALVFRQLHRNSEFVANGTNYLQCLEEDQQLLRMYLTPRAPTACYDKALEYNPQNPHKILAKKASTLKVNFYETPQDFQTAFELLDESIEADGSICNRVAYSVRAETYMDLYRSFRKDRTGDREVTNLYKLRKDRTGRDDNWMLLIKAKDDYEESLRLHTEPIDCRQLGDIWRYLSQEHNEEISRIVGKNKTLCLETALEFYTIATEIVPDGSENPHTHCKRGDCLLELENPLEAAESYKRAIQCYKYFNNNMKLTYGRLFEAHLRMLEPGQTNCLSNVDLVQEATKWFEVDSDVEENSRFEEETSTFTLIQGYRFRDRREMLNRLQLFIGICRDIGEDNIASDLEMYCTRYY